MPGEFVKVIRRNTDVCCECTRPIPKTQPEIWFLMGDPNKYGVYCDACHAVEVAMNPQSVESPPWE